MATSLDSPLPYDESPLDGDDVVYPCKGCGEILEEGKAFELAGNRWHIDCFRCHTCGTLLDSDANLLLLGDGSLICNNCTYSCSACGNKIEDLAILTGDQAFCAGCFRCRSCKRKIDNLRYARTSQGIFCMSCHESLMARRRKKAKAKSSTTNGGTGATTSEKTLPPLPPNAAHGAAFAPDTDTADESATGTPRATSPQRSNTMKVPGSQRRDRDRSPLSDDEHREGTTLPSSTYRDNRSPDYNDDPEQGFLPMAFDPNPAPRGPQVSRKRVPQVNEASPSAEGQSKDYFAGKDRDYLRNEPSISSRSASAEREQLQNLHFPAVNQPKLSPHIAFQDKNRTSKRVPSGTSTPGSYAQSSNSPVAATHAERDRTQTKPPVIQTTTYNDAFKLQEVPQDKKSGINGRGVSPGISPVKRSIDDGSISPVSDDSVNPFDDPKLKEASPSIPAPIPTRHADRPARGDSLAAAKLSSTSNRSSVDPSTPLASNQKSKTHDRQESMSSVHTNNYVDARETSTKDVESPNAPFGAEGPPPRASSRPTVAPFTSAKDDFVAPRAPPQPPSEAKHQRSASSQLSDGASTGQSSPALRNSGLPRLASDGTFSMEKEMSRILRGDRDENESSSSMLRRVSNAVKHGRSFSDRGSLSKIVPPVVAESGVTSPSTVSSSITSPITGQDTVESLRAQLRRAHRRITELETEKSGLEDKVNTSTTINEVNDELNQKRTTMAFLDSQREIIVRELETMTSHLEKAKDSKQPLDLPSLESDILQAFADKMQKLKDHLSTQIEDLMRRRNELTNEITDLIAMKDKGFQEYESLSTKNAQLGEMNTQLLLNIQEGFKANKDARQNGLGIYHPGARVETANNTEMRNLNLVSTESSMPNLLQETDAEPVTVLPAPQVVDIRKGQVKKFNWRKGGERVAKGVTKGIKGAFATTGEKPTIDVSQIGLPYGMTQQATPGGEQTPITARQGLFGHGQKNGRVAAPAGLKDLGVVPAADPSTLFGSELEARCDFEKRIIPSIVMRCIAEVESRGMHVEGIYRKSGGSGQVKSVQAGFEKDSNHDISDPDLEIHAVTSALKQYFRKLPTPLITYDVYDSLLDAGSVADKDRQAIALRHALAELPPHHKGCLEYLVRHLARVMNLERDNLMTPLNLAVVFAPTIMRPLSIEREMSDGLAQRAAVQALLELHEVIFEDE